MRVIRRAVPAGGPAAEENRSYSSCPAADDPAAVPAEVKDGGGHGTGRQPGPSAGGEGPGFSPSAMARVFAQAIGRVGAKAGLYRGGELLGQCAVSLQSRSGAGMESGLSIGYYNRRQLVLYAPCAGPADGLQRGDRVELSGFRCHVQAVEDVLYQEQPVYYRIWALPEQEG